MRKSKVNQDSIKTIEYSENSQSSWLSEGNLGKFMLAVLLPMVVGVASATFSHEGMQIYKTMAKPPLSPPAIVFPIVWTILYFLMGTASYIVLETDASETQKSMANTTYLIQLAMNFFWSIIFFNLQLYTLAFIWLVGMYAVIIACSVYFFSIRRLAGYLMIPYIVWMAFAAYLNMAIAIMK